ncbi:MAG TPA: hypothetical protein VFK30_12165 [Anaerolineae bacterium]|nr:hypothetical protein [Anaerolineae bacterium]
MSSRFTLNSLTRQQRLILGLALLMNVIVLGVLVWLVTSPSVLPEPLPQPTEPGNTIECENNAALNLRQQGISGSITINRTESIQVYVDSSDASTAWNVFSTTLTLLRYNCGPYAVVRVNVPDPDQRPNLRLVLEVNWADVQSWANRSIDDGQLSDRMRRRIYQTP